MSTGSWYFFNIYGIYGLFLTESVFDTINVVWEYLVKRIRPSRPEKESGDVHAPRRVVSSSPGKGIEKGERSGSRGSSTVPLRDRAREEERHRRILSCPVCSVQMGKKMTGGVELDECPTCGGIFLDRGELKIISGQDFSSYESASSGHGTASEKPFLIYTPHGLSEHIKNLD